MGKFNRKGPKWRQTEVEKAKIIKRNIEVKKDIIKDVKAKDILNVPLNNKLPEDSNSSKLMIGWQLLLALMLAGAIINILYTYVNGQGYSLYRISFTESTWYAFVLCFIIFVSLSVFISMLCITKYILNVSDSLLVCYNSLAKGFEKLSKVSVILFVVYLLLPLSTYIKFFIIIAFIIIMFVGIYDSYVKYFKDHRLRYFAIALVITLLICQLLTGLIQGNFTRLF